MIVEIQPRENCLVWENNPKNGFERHVRLSVPMGYKAYFIVDGALRGTYLEGGYDLDLKSELKEQRRIQFLGEARDRVFSLPIGVGEIVFFVRNGMAKEQMALGVNGKYSFKVNDGLKLYSEYRGSENKVTVDTIKGKIAEVLVSEIRSELSEFLEGNQNWRMVGNHLGELSAKIEQKCKTFFNNQAKGITLDSFSLCGTNDFGKTAQKILSDEEFIEPFLTECPKCRAKCNSNEKNCPVCGTALNN